MSVLTTESPGIKVPSLDDQFLLWSSPLRKVQTTAKPNRCTKLPGGFLKPDTQSESGSMEDVFHFWDPVGSSACWVCQSVVDSTDWGERSDGILRENGLFFPWCSEDQKSSRTRWLWPFLKSQILIGRTAWFAVERRTRDLLDQGISQGVVALLNILQKSSFLTPWPSEGWHLHWCSSN